MAFIRFVLFPSNNLNIILTLIIVNKSKKSRFHEKTAKFIQRFIRSTFCNIERDKRGDGC